MLLKIPFEMPDWLSEGFNTLFKIQAQTYLAVSKYIIILKLRSVNYLSKIRQLKQLSKESVRCCSQKYFNISIYQYLKSICCGF